MLINCLAHTRHSINVSFLPLLLLSASVHRNPAVGRRRREEFLERHRDVEKHWRDPVPTDQQWKLSAKSERALSETYTVSPEWTETVDGCWENLRWNAHVLPQKIKIKIKKWNYATLSRIQRKPENITLSISSILYYIRSFACSENILFTRQKRSAAI